MKKENFGQTRAGVQASLYTMENENGMELKVTDYGATLVNIMVVDKNSRKRDVVLGYDDVSGYETGASFFGAETQTELRGLLLNLVERHSAWTQMKMETTCTAD